MRNLWTWLNNKKTIVAAVYWQLSAGVIAIWYPSGLPDALEKIYLTVGTILTVFGLGHKAAKKLIGGVN